MSSIHWPFGNKTVTLQLSSLPPQVQVQRNEGGHVFCHQAECSFPFQRIKSRDFFHQFRDHFYPIVRRFSDGAFSVSFHTRGLGGGGICCKEEDPNTRQPLLQARRALPVELPRVPQPVLAAQIPLPQVDLAALNQKIQIMGETCQKTFSEYADTYIPAVERTGDKEVDLEWNVMQFLSSDQRVLLLTGDAGSGKSLFLECLASNLWQSYQPQGPIPFFIPLPSLKNPVERCIEESLEVAGFTCDEIVYLKASKSFIFIMDAYDELSINQNLFVSNRLDQWNCKIVISCRSQYLSGNYLDLFIPRTNDRSYPGLIREKNIALFSSSQIDSYIQKKVEQGDTGWKDWQDCKHHIDTIPGLAFLVQNPFDLTIVVQILLEILNRYERLQVDESLQLTRNEIYRFFLEQWFDRQQKKIRGQDLREEFWEFSKRLARKMHEKGVCHVSYDENEDLFNAGTSEWSPFFSSLDPKVVLIRSGCPLRKVGNQWSFIHTTVRDFFISEELFNKMQDLPLQDEERKAFIAKIIGIIGKRLIVDQTVIIQLLAESVQTEPHFRDAFFEIVRLSSKDAQLAIAASNAITILNAARIPFSGLNLAEIQIPGAHLEGAIFDGTNLEGANLRDVVLKDAFLRQCCLRNSDMAGVDFGQYPYVKLEDLYTVLISDNNKWLISGEHNSTIYLWDPESKKTLTLYEKEGLVSSNPQPDMTHCAFSYDTKLLVSPDISPFNLDHAICLWNLETGTVVKTFKGHSGKVVCCNFSMDNRRVVSASLDQTIRLWDVSSGELLKVFQGDLDETSLCLFPWDYVTAVSFAKKTICIWDIETGQIIDRQNEAQLIAKNPDDPKPFSYGSEFRNTFSKVARGGRAFEVWGDKLKKMTPFPKTSLVPALACSFFFENRFLISISKISSHYIYDLTSKVGLRVAKGGRVPFAFSPNSRRIACQIKDHTIQVDQLDIEQSLDSLEAQHKTLSTLVGHTKKITSCAFSSDGMLLASGSEDTMIRLWKVMTGELVKVFKGHKSSVAACTFSHDDRLLASGSGGIRDNHDVYLWNIAEGKIIKVLKGLRAPISTCAFSPDGRWIASIDECGGLNAWDARTGSIIWALIEGSGCYSTTYDNRPTNPCSFSQDSTQLASSGVSHSVCLWDMETGKLSQELKEGDMATCVFSSDGKLFATGGSDGIHLWDTKALNVKSSVDRSNIIRGITSCTFSAEGRYLILSGHDRTIYLWDMKRRQTVEMLIGHQREIECCAASKNGRWLASGSQDSLIHLWDLKTKKTIRILENDIINASSFCKDICYLHGHVKKIYFCSFFRDGSRFLSASEDQTIRLWDLTTGQQMKVLNGCKNRVVISALSKNGKWLALGSTNHKISLWNLEEEREIQVFKKHARAVVALDFTEEQWLISITEDGAIHKYNLETEKESFISFRSEEPCALSFDGRLTALTCPNHTIRLLETETNKTVQILDGHTKEIYFCSFSPNGKKLVSASEDGTVIFWDLQGAKNPEILEKQKGRISSCVFSSKDEECTLITKDNIIRFISFAASSGSFDGMNFCAFAKDRPWAAEVGEDNIIKIKEFPMKSGVSRENVVVNANERVIHPNRVIYPSRESVKCCAVSPDDKWLTSTTSKDIHLREISTGRTLSVLVGHTNEISGCVFSPNGNDFASSSWDHTVRMWDTKTWLTSGILEHSASVLNCTFSPDGSILASGCADHNIYLWDVKTRKLLRILHGHKDIVRTCTFSPNSQLLVSGSYDCQVYFWDIQTGGVIKSFKRKHKIDSCAFSPDGEFLAVIDGLTNGGEMDFLQIFDEKHRLQPQLVWSSSTYFSAEKADLTDVNHLSPSNRALLEQYRSASPDQVLP